MRERGKEIDLCIENRDRSRMQTALKRVLRGNGDGRACCASRRQRSTHTYVDFLTRSMYQPGYRHVTDHRKTCISCLDPGCTSATNWEITCTIEMLSWIRATSQFLCLRVGDASVMNNFWSIDDTRISLVSWAQLLSSRI